ncbi:MAG TPA: DUF1501 domain-containing protein, partial [Gemmataceae bacterium]|nr:DUF1501 domain-containing protein [Gemmataceae bacterium]
MPSCTYACGTPDHAVSRRAFLGASTVGITSAFGSASAASELSRAQKRVLVIFLSGGVSQLETWDPKPGTDTGGPFRAIPTSVPGTHICELLPHTAKQMHRLALVRGINTKEDEHGRGATIMLTGRRTEPGLEYPQIGAVAAKLLGTGKEELPGHIQITPRGGSGFNKQDAAFLGPRFASVTLADGKPPADLFRPAALTTEADRQREALRQKLNERFAKSRRTAQTEAYTESYDQAAKFIAKGDVFSVGAEDPKLADRYGRHDFGRHLLLARRLLENNVTFVKVTHTNYDTHHENFDFHIEQLGEFDRPFAALLTDLADRGMLESTLVVVMSEFGRTPRINDRYGRDHWSKAWSVALGGCGIKAGAVVGKTNANGTAVTDREVNGGHLFHTYFRALGVDPTKNFYPNDRPVPIADPAAGAITELLA